MMIRKNGKRFKRDYNNMAIVRNFVFILNPMGNF